MRCESARRHLGAFALLSLSRYVAEGAEGRRTEGRWANIESAPDPTTHSSPSDVGQRRGPGAPIGVLRRGRVDLPCFQFGSVRCLEQTDRPCHVVPVHLERCIGIIPESRLQCVVLVPRDRSQDRSARTRLPRWQPVTEVQFVRPVPRHRSRAPRSCPGATAERRAVRSTFEDVPLPLGFWLTEQRQHPVVRREPQGETLGFDLTRPSRLAGAGYPDHDEEPTWQSGRRRWHPDHGTC